MQSNDTIITHNSPNRAPTNERRTQLTDTIITHNPPNRAPTNERRTRSTDNTITHNPPNCAPAKERRTQSTYPNNTHNSRNRAPANERRNQPTNEDIARTAPEPPPPCTSEPADNNRGAAEPESALLKNAKKVGWGLGYIVAAPICLGLGAVAGTVFAAGTILKGAGDVVSGVGSALTGATFDD
jgi:hypothetical protein